MLDAGVSDVENARAWLGLGVRRIVIGSETLCSWSALQDIPAGIDPNSLVFSLDLRFGKILSRCPALAPMSPLSLMKHLQSFGWKEIILLDLDRVGSSTGADRTLTVEACARFPDLSLLVGGGITSPEELFELKSLGIRGVLAATALHRGTIGAEHISTLRVKN